jgi:hypothetical protein
VCRPEHLPGPRNDLAQEISTKPVVSSISDPVTTRAESSTTDAHRARHEGGDASGRARCFEVMRILLVLFLLSSAALLSTLLAGAA